MEFFNAVEIKGVVGRVTKTQAGELSIVNFSVMTERAYTDKKGTPTVETTWFNCVSYNDVPIDKGDNVHCLGRFRARRYTDNSGAERICYEVVTNSVTILQKYTDAQMRHIR